jgi:hypothetical protein
MLTDFVPAGRLSSYRTSPYKARIDSLDSSLSSSAICLSSPQSMCASGFDLPFTFRSVDSRCRAAAVKPRLKLISVDVYVV